MNIDTDSEVNSFKRDAKPKILIIEPLLTGHHGNYLQNLATGALQRNYEVIIATSAANRDSPLLSWVENYENIKIDFNECLNFTLKGTGGAFGLLKRELLYYYNFKKVYAQHKSQNIDFVVLPYADYCLYAIGLLGSPFGNTKWKGIAMRPSFHHKEMNIKSNHDKSAATKRFLFERVIKSANLNKLCTIDSALFEYYSNHCGQKVNKLIYIADPAEEISFVSKKNAREHLNINYNSCVILVYGALSLRKGVQNLLPLITNEKCAQNFHLLLVGQTDTQFKELLNCHNYKHLELEKRCTLIDVRASSELQNIVFSAADISWLGYHQHYGMSGVLILSELFDIPSIVCTNGLLGWLNSKYNFGISTNELLDNHFQVSDNLIKLIQKIRRIKHRERVSFINKHNWTAALKSIFG